jgi:RNase P/RNase MRP subunit p29
MRIHFSLVESFIIVESPLSSILNPWAPKNDRFIRVNMLGGERKTLRVFFLSIDGQKLLDILNERLEKSREKS